jgi:hypothetical protein
VAIIPRMPSATLTDRIYRNADEISDAGFIRHDVWTKHKISRIFDIEKDFTSIDTILEFMRTR